MYENVLQFKTTLDLKGDNYKFIMEEDTVEDEEDRKFQQVRIVMKTPQL